MRNRLRTVMFGIGLMILLAQPAFAEELGQANITPHTKMAEIRSILNFHTITRHGMRSMNVM